MASITNRTQSIFSNLVPSWLFPKTRADKITAVVLLSLASVAALVCILKSLRGRARKYKDTPKPVETATEANTSETSSKDTPKPVETATEANTSETSSKGTSKPVETATEANTETKNTTTELTTSLNSISKRVVAKFDVGYGNHLSVNGIDMENDGTPDGWKSPAQAPINVSESMKFSIYDSNKKLVRELDSVLYEVKDEPSTT